MPSPTERQTELLQEIQGVEPELQFEWDSVRGIASYLRGNLSLLVERTEELESTLAALLERYGELFGPPVILDALELRRRRTDDLGWTHLEYQQFFSRPDGRRRKKERKIEVYGSRLVGHFNAEGGLIEVQSSCWPDIQLRDDPLITRTQLKEVLTKLAEQAPGYRELQASMREQNEENFPIMQEPRLVIHPWKEEFRLAWTTYAYGPLQTDDRTGEPTGKQEIVLGQTFVDASTGEQFLFMPTGRYLETNDTGSGRAVTPLGGPFTVRSLNIVRVDSTSTYLLKDKTHGREIITYDAAANSSWVYPSLAGQLEGGTVPVSSDTDGDRNWDRLPTDTTDAQRTSGQQPEADAHFMVLEIYEWFDALAGGRAGWDNGQYSAPLVPNQVIRVATHVFDNDPSTNSSRSVNAFMDKQLVSGHWVAYLAFFDGDPTATCSMANDRGWDCLAGSKFIVGHEYGHAITDFNFEDAAGNPGLRYPMAPNPEWLSAVHEGMSDVFGILISENWAPGQEVSISGMVFRNLAYPRDPNSWVNRAGSFPCGLSNACRDHFDDRNLSNFRYARGTILAHCAYLMGAGGVHQRVSRTPALIPVYSMGRQTVGGRDFLRAARIWYRAYTNYFSTHGTLTGIPTNDESCFRTLRNACVSAAQDIYGVGSLEHKTTILAFYAVGLQPAGTPYGADVTFLRWGWDWRFSRPYIGIPSPDWASRDVYVKNGAAASGWNALINVLDGAGNPTQFENDVYCRVRNIGDQEANNVVVTFEYTKIGTGMVTWLPVQDKNGVTQTLNLGTLAAGQSNFADSAQETPPAAAGIKWYIAPLAAGETVDHFCLRATVTSSNDVNIFNNQVQSNINYAAYTPGTGLRMSFVAGNPTQDAIPLELATLASLPKGWRVEIPQAREIQELRPGEEREIEIVVDMLEGADQELQPPFDGEIEGELFGYITGSFSGTLTDSSWDGARLRGQLAANVEFIGALVGQFDGQLDVHTGQLKGRVSGTFQYEEKEGMERVPVGVHGCLRPYRRIEVSQIVHGQPIGGFTIQVQVPPPAGECAKELPPTDTQISL